MYLFITNLKHTPGVTVFEVKYITQDVSGLIDDIYIFDFKQCFINVHFFCFFTAAVMKNTGVLFANDINPDRIKAVVGNFHRLGVVNSVVSSCDGRKFSVVSLWYLIAFVCACML